MDYTTSNRYQFDGIDYCKMIVRSNMTTEFLNFLDACQNCKLFSAIIRYLPEYHSTGNLQVCVFYKTRCFNFRGSDFFSSDYRKKMKQNLIRIKAVCGDLCRIEAVTPCFRFLPRNRKIDLFVNRTIGFGGRIVKPEKPENDIDSANAIFIVAKNPSSLITKIYAKLTMLKLLE